MELTVPCRISTSPRRKKERPAAPRPGVPLFRVLLARSSRTGRGHEPHDHCVVMVTSATRLFPHVSNELMNELIRQFENFGLDFPYNLESILNSKDKAGDSIWAFILACHGMMSLEYNQAIEEVWS